MQAHAAAPAFPATPESSIVLVGSSAETRVRAALKRFEHAVQNVLDAPLDADQVLEWTTLRALSI